MIFYSDGEEVASQGDSQIGWPNNVRLEKDVGDVTISAILRRVIDDSNWYIGVDADITVKTK